MIESPGPNSHSVRPWLRLRPENIELRARSIVSRIFLICILVIGMSTLLPAEPLERYVAVDDVCAWPNLTLLKDGTLTATIFNQPHHGLGEGDVESWVSTDGGRIWELGGVVAPHEDGSNRMNVAAGAAHDGSVVVLASGWGGAGFRERILPSLVCRSSDGGRTWEQSPGVTLPDGVQNLIPFGDIVQAPGNVLVAPGYSWKLPNIPSGSTAYVLFSLDDGRTWTENAVIAEDDFNETALIRLKSGRWLAAIRTRGDGHLELFSSEDEARSWTPGGTLTPPRHHPAHLVQLYDGRVILTYGIREASRKGVGYRVSSDDGRTWGPPDQLVHLEGTGDGGYPATVQLADEMLVTAYYSDGIGEHRRYHMGVVRWLPPGK